MFCLRDKKIIILTVHFYLNAWFTSLLTENKAWVHINVVVSVEKAKYFCVPSDLIHISEGKGHITSILVGSKYQTFLTSSREFHAILSRFSIRRTHD